MTTIPLHAFIQQSFGIETPQLRSLSDDDSSHAEDGLNEFTQTKLIEIQAG